MFLTIAFCEGEKQKAYGILRTVYDTYLEASNKASAIAGELAGLTAHIHVFFFFYILLLRSHFDRLYKRVLLSNLLLDTGHYSMFLVLNMML